MKLEKLFNTPYYEFIQNIIESRGQWNPPTSYWEGHHILPRCLGGKGYSRQQHTNIVWLTAAEHFIAHRLLVQLFPTNTALLNAFWAMCTVSNSTQHVIISPEEYQQLKEARGKTIGNQVRQQLIGTKAVSSTRAKHHEKQAGSLNGFFNKKHSKETLSQLSKSKGKPVRHINTGVEYDSSYEAAKALNISRVLINNCCRGKQTSTHNGMMFEYIDPEDKNIGLPNSSLTKYERRRRIILLRKLVVKLDIEQPDVLLVVDKTRIKKLATCENYRYLISLLKQFKIENKKELADYLVDGAENTKFTDELKDIILKL